VSRSVTALGYVTRAASSVTADFATLARTPGMDRLAWRAETLPRVRDPPKISRTPRRAPNPCRRQQRVSRHATSTPRALAKSATPSGDAETSSMRSWAATSPPPKHGLPAAQETFRGRTRQVARSHPHTAPDPANGTRRAVRPGAQGRARHPFKRASWWAVWSTASAPRGRGLRAVAGRPWRASRSHSPRASERLGPKLAERLGTS
jgi:hypothetical protein